MLAVPIAICYMSTPWSIFMYTLPPTGENRSDTGDGLDSSLPVGNGIGVSQERNHITDQELKNKKYTNKLPDNASKLTVTVERF